MTRRFNFYQKSKKKFKHHFDIHVSKIFQVYFLTGKYKLLIDFYNKEETIIYLLHTIYAQTARTDQMKRGHV